jgi:SsrA-binding protein
MNGKKSGKDSSGTIALNRKVRHDFFIEERFEAGLALQGWEVKSIRDGRVQLNESYILIKNGEAWLFGVHITPLTSASTHIKADPTRNRKVLLHRRELDKLIGAVERKGWCRSPCTGRTGWPSWKSPWPAASRARTSALPRRRVTGNARKGGCCAIARSDACPRTGPKSASY